MESNNILDDEMTTFDDKKASPSTSEKFDLLVRNIYNSLYLIATLIHWALNIWWLNFAPKMISTSHEIIGQKSDLLLYAIPISFILTAFGTIEYIKLYRPIIVLGIFALTVSLYLLFGPIYFYYKN